MDMIAEKFDKEKVDVYLSVDMTYAYGHVPLHELTKKHCNFQIVGGKVNRDVLFQNGILRTHCNADRIPKIVMDLTLVNLKGVFVYVDDILIVTKGFKTEHSNKVREVMKVLDAANLQLKAEKSVIAQDSIEWLGYKLTKTGISPVNAKSQGTTE